MPADKLLPHDLEAEQVILGSVLLDSKAIFEASELLHPNDFYLERNRIVFRIMTELSARGEVVDRWTVRAELDRRGELDKIDELDVLTLGVPGGLKLAPYCRIVRERAVSRKLIQLGHQLEVEAWQQEKAPRELLEKLQSELLDLYSRGQEGGLKALSDVVSEGFRELEKRKSGASGNAVMTGFADIDKATGGFRPSNLIILAARPSIGKSALAVNIAVNAALKGARIAIFSLEMSQTEIYDRMLSSQSGIRCDRIVGGYVSRQDWPRIVDASAKLSQAPIWIDDSGSLSMMQMTARAKRLQADRGLDMIIVDYLQQVQAAGKSIYERVTEVSRALKILAKDLKIPVLALSQLHRLQSETAEPELSDLRESGAIEQDADLVCVMWKSESDNIRNFKIKKQRNGPLAFIELAWVGEQTKFMTMNRRNDEPGLHQTVEESPR